MSAFRFLASQPLAVLLFCLAAGFALGRVRLGPLPANATFATLVVSVAANLVLRRFGVALSYPDALRSLFFAFFSFAIGFSAGPGFADSVRRDGLRAVLRQGALALAYAAFAALSASVFAAVCGFSSEGTARGLLAGALTQSTILSSSLAGDPGMALAYGLSYVVGLAAAIVFVQTAAPRLLGVSLTAAVKRHLDETGAAGRAAGFVLPARAIQVRAYRVRAGTPLDGGTVGATEAAAPGRFEIAAVHRGGEELALSQETRIAAGDVLVAVGDRRVLSELPLDRVEETVDDRYLSAELALADVVLADGKGPGVLADLAARGVLLRAAIRNGRPLPETRLSGIRAGDVLRVAGLARSVDGFVRANGYRRDDGAPSDLFTLTAAVGVAAVLGAVSLGGVSLGTGGCSLLLGLACGCVNRRRPAVGHLPGSALALLRSLGLNLFIAALALGAEVSPSALFGSAALRLALAAAAVSLVPLAGALAFGRFVLRLPPVPLLGALCGAATCTPALNALEEETGSSAFTAAYTLPYVFSNILLTILGSTVPRLLVAAPGPF